MRRADAVARWSAVASGKIDDDTRAWLAGVAKALLLANDEKDTNDRRQAISRAVGFTGQGDDSLLLAIRQMVAEVEDEDQLRMIVRVLRHDFQSKVSKRAIDLQIKRAREANSAAAEK